MDQTGFVILEIKSDLAIIRLGAEEDGLVILNRKRLESFRDAIRAVRSEKQLKGLVVIGNGRGFCAGADINLINALNEVEEAEKLAKEGQQIFAELESLSIPSIAAISGPCVGGGCELALACTYRIGTVDSKIGLPEIKLGILPGFGGTQRLPRLVGLFPALDVIIQGKTLFSRQAKKIGLYDDLVSEHKDLERLACEIARGEKKVRRAALPFREKLFLRSAFLRKLILPFIRKKTLAATKGHYPAPIKALESIFYGLSAPREKGFLREAQLLADLAVSPESKSLVHVYFLSEWAGKLGKSFKSEVKGAKISVIGAGTMGAGIAGAFLARGFKVALVEPIEQVRAKAQAQISAFISKQKSLSEKQKEQTLLNLEISGNFGAIKDSKLVVEAIIEDVDTKREVFAKVQTQVDEACVIASNTSSLSIDLLTAELEPKDRLIGMHFFNPAEKMPLVEIVRAKQTSERSLLYLAALSSEIGKFPVVVENVPGFLVNRILTPYLVEAAHLIFEGYRIEDIDRAASSFGMPMGPVRLLDEVGLAVAAKVSEVLESAYGQRMSGPNYAKILCEAGRFGKKAGLGFYKYSDKKSAVDHSVYKLLGLRVERKAKVNQSYLNDRLILSMLNEAVRALDDGVAGAPGEGAAKQIDLASVMGIGFPPFRGGIIRYAQSRGARDILRSLELFLKEGIARLEPAPGLRKRAELEIGFYQ